MNNKNQKTWLTLLHQLPPKPSYFRVRIWRRLQQIGAVAVKQSVYVLPEKEGSREDLGWLIKEIQEGGGEGYLLEARFLEGMTDDQVIALFQEARQSDYEKVIREANLLLADRDFGRIDPQDPVAKVPAQVSKLRRRLDEVSAIDFFQAPERGTAEMLIQELAVRLSEKASIENITKSEIESLKGKTWVTRENLFIDRIACGWLIRRFVDEGAVFKFVSGPKYSPKPGELRFDMFDGEFTHEGGQCTFEIMIQRLQLADRALVPLAEIVHDIDLKDAKYDHPETEGIKAFLTGLVNSQLQDEKRMEEGYRLFENVYAFFTRNKGN